MCPSLLAYVSMFKQIFEHRYNKLTFLIKIFPSLSTILEANNISQSSSPSNINSARVDCNSETIDNMEIKPLVMYIVRIAFDPTKIQSTNYYWPKCLRVSTLVLFATVPRQ